MARPKLPRKSTTIDMTAMCDVAFLLLSFFILTTKFKPEESVTIQTPNSVSTKPVDGEENIVLVSISPDGKIFLSMEDAEKKVEVLEALNSQQGLKLSPNEIQALAEQPVWGSDINQLKQVSGLSKDKINGANLPGIVAKDSANNQVTLWMGAVTTVYPTRNSMTLMLKGDQESKYPALKQVIEAFKKNGLMNFKLVTNPEGVPAGTELYAQNVAAARK